MSTMKNPKLAIKTMANGKFKAVVIGDTYQGPNRGYALLPHQARHGHSHAAARKVAMQYKDTDLVALVGDQVGSYANSKLDFEILDTEQNGGSKLTRDRNTTVDTTELAALLIEQRRAALRELARIDAELMKLSVIPVQAVQIGMSRALPAVQA